MTNSLVGTLILKDWRLQRPQIVFSILAGAIALAVVQRGTEVTVVVGGVWFFISLIMVGTMLPMAGIMNERKKQNLAFLMSLPISPMQYTTSKLLSSTGMFMIPWATLVLAAVLLIQFRGIFPHGVIPLVVILALMPFVAFCIMTAAALIGETEGWGIAANVACSSSYGLVWFFMTRVPGLMANNRSPVVVWNSTTLKVVGTELVLIPLLLGITYFVQSHKRDFI